RTARHWPARQSADYRRTRRPLPCDVLFARPCITRHFLATLWKLDSCRLAERVGLLRPASRNPNEDEPFLLKPHNTSNLAFANSFSRFHPFASIFGFFQRNEIGRASCRERVEHR